MRFPESKAKLAVGPEPPLPRLPLLPPVNVLPDVVAGNDVPVISLFSYLSDPGICARRARG
jgi:hypothetical protein